MCTAESPNRVSSNQAMPMGRCPPLLARPNQNCGQCFCDATNADLLEQVPTMSVGSVNAQAHARRNGLLPWICGRQVEILGFSRREPQNGYQLDPFVAGQTALQPLWPRPCVPEEGDFRGRCRRLNAQPTLEMRKTHLTYRRRDVTRHLVARWNPSLGPAAVTRRAPRAS